MRERIAEKLKERKVKLKADKRELKKLYEQLIQRTNNNDRTFHTSPTIRKVLRISSMLLLLYVALMINVSIDVFQSDRFNAVSLGMAYLKDGLSMLAMCIVLYQRSRVGPTDKVKLLKWKQRVRQQEFFLILGPLFISWLDTAWRRYVRAEDYITGNISTMVSVAFFTIIIVAVAMATKPDYLFSKTLNGLVSASSILGPLGMIIVTIVYENSLTSGPTFGSTGLIFTLSTFIFLELRNIFTNKRPTIIQQQVVDMSSPMHLFNVLKERDDNTSEELKLLNEVNPFDERQMKNAVEMILLREEWEGILNRRSAQVIIGGILLSITSNVLWILLQDPIYEARDYLIRLLQ